VLFFFLKGLNMKLLLLSENQDAIESFVKHIDSQNLEMHKHSLARINSIPFHDYSLVILDVCGRSGKTRDFLNKICLVAHVPLFVITDNPVESFAASCYDFGADGIIRYPENITSSIPMIRAFLRRFGSTHPQVEDIPNHLPFKILQAERAVMIGEKKVSLTRSEFDTIAFMLMHPSRIITRQVFLDNAKASGQSVSDNRLNIQIARIRMKCGFTSKHPIETIRGVGYRLNIGSSKKA
jgi:two-component system, OmpR family, alkaline phosphatase synthesis response regulator PhoP